MKDNMHHIRQQSGKKSSSFHGHSTNNKDTTSTSTGNSSFHNPQHHHHHNTTATASPETNTMKTSSISSSSTGSRRRQKERERASRSRFKDNGSDTDRVVMQGERISPIMEIGGGGFVRDDILDSSDRSSGKRKNNSSLNRLDWSDRSVDGIPPLPPLPQQQQQQLPSQMMQPNQYQYVQPPQQQQQQQRGVLHACDEKTGRCLFHPQITLRKKAILGVMGGWKDVLRACPECEAEDVMRMTANISTTSGESLPQQIPTHIMQPGEGRLDSGAERDVYHQHQHQQSRISNKTRSRTLSPIDQRRKRGGEAAAVSGGKKSGKQKNRSRSKKEESSESEDDDDSEDSSSSSSSESKTKPERRTAQPARRGRNGSLRGTANNLSNSFTNKNKNPASVRAGDKLKKSIAKVARPWNTIDTEADVPDSFISSYISSGVPSQEHSKTQSRREQHQSQPHLRHTSQKHPQSQPSIFAYQKSQTKSPPNSGSSGDIRREKLAKGVSGLLRKGKTSFHTVKSSIRTKAHHKEDETFDSSGLGLDGSEYESKNDSEFYYDVDDDESSTVVDQTEKLEQEEEPRHLKRAENQENHGLRRQFRRDPSGQLSSGPVGSSITSDGIRVFSVEDETSPGGLRRSRSDSEAVANELKHEVGRHNSLDNTASGMSPSVDNVSEEEMCQQLRDQEKQREEDEAKQKKILDQVKQSEKEELRQRFISRDQEKQRMKEAFRQRILHDQEMRRQEELRQQELLDLEKQRQEEEQRRQQLLDEEKQRQKQQWEEENMRYFEQRIKEELAEKERREKMQKENEQQLKSSEAVSPSLQKFLNKESAHAKRDEFESQQSSEEISLENVGSEESPAIDDNNAKVSSDGFASSGSTQPDRDKEDREESAKTNGENSRFLTEGSIKINLSNLEPFKRERNGDEPVKQSGLLSIDLTSLQASKHKKENDTRSNKIGGLNIDLSSLQASRSAKNDSNGLNIDLSSLQPSRSSKNDNEKSFSGSEGSIKIDRAALQPSRNIRRNERVKTFEVSNLPWAGRFGDSGYYTGSVTEQYEPYGKGTMMYDNGIIRKGHWRDGDFVRESLGDSDSEDDDDSDGDEGADNDLTFSMADLSTGNTSKYGSRDRSRSRSRSKDREAPPKKVPEPERDPQPEPEPVPLPSYKIGEVGKKEDMITDASEALEKIAELKVDDGAFIRRSDGKWTFATVKVLEENEGGPAIRFSVNERKSSKSYNKKYWGSHIRPMKRVQNAAQQLLQDDPSDSGSVSSAAEREGRSKQREPAGKLTRQASSSSISSTGSEQGDDAGRGASCPPVETKTKFDWPKRNFRSRSRSRRRAVSASPMRQMFAITESDMEDEEDEPDPDTVHFLGKKPGANLGQDTISGSGYALRGIDP